MAQPRPPRMRKAAVAAVNLGIIIYQDIIIRLTEQRIVALKNYNNYKKVSNKYSAKISEENSGASLSLRRSI